MPKIPRGWSISDYIGERVEEEIDRKVAEKKADTLGDAFWVREIEKSLARSFAEAVEPRISERPQYPGKRYGASKKVLDDMLIETYKPEQCDKDRLEKGILLPLRVEKENEETYRIIGDFTAMSDRMRLRFEQDVSSHFDMTDELWGIRLVLKKRV